jgi:hypothetical protein
VSSAILDAVKSKLKRKELHARSSMLQKEHHAASSSHYAAVPVQTLLQILDEFVLQKL